MDLFDSAAQSHMYDVNTPSHEPLASRMRPRTLDEFAGQDHIVGQGRLLRRAIQADQLSSLIFYGPPGTGKTTLARVIANQTRSHFLTLNAVLTGVAHIRESIAQAETHRKLYGHKTILFVDEVHRWNKSQQDALLPWVENGTIILIGATTENPFFEVNKALVSRSRIFQLVPLEKKDLHKAALSALGDVERGYGKWYVCFEDGALDHLVDTANGDARSLLNALELAVETTPEHFPPPEGSEIYITLEIAEESIQQKVVLYDRDGDYHYDVISAFIKSIRGSDPDASLYWLARMVEAGESPHFIFRRLSISACEDIGLADPYAITVVESCAQAFDRIGLPEGRFHLTHATLYLATCPKSNSALAFFDALESVKKEDAVVPTHLKDSGRDSEGFGHGEGYVYPHAYKDHWVAQQYLPSGLQGQIFYMPSEIAYEKTIRDDVLRRREIQVAAILEGDSLAFPSGDILTFTPTDKGRDRWYSRLDASYSEHLRSIRSHMLECAALVRHHRCLIWNADDGLLLWEIARKAAEGLTYALCRSESARHTLESYAKNVYASSQDDLEKPYLLTGHYADFESALFADAVVFDRIFYRDPCTKFSDIGVFSTHLYSLFEHSCAEHAVAVIAQKIPARGQRLSALIADCIESDLLRDFQAAEECLFDWDTTTMCGALEEKGFTVRCELVRYTDMRRISEAQLEKWFCASDSTYRLLLIDTLGEESVERLYDALKKVCLNAGDGVLWLSTYAFFTIQKRSLQEDVCTSAIRRARTVAAINGK